MRLLGAAAMARDVKGTSRALGDMERRGRSTGRSLSGMERASAMASAGFARFESGMGAVAGGLSSVEAGARRVISVTTVMASAIGGALAFTGSRYNAMQDQQRIAFTAMTRSAEEAEEIIKRIGALADASPTLDPGNVGQGVQRMMAYGLSVEQSFEAVERIGDMAPVAGKAIEEAMGQASLAFGQIQSKGKLSAEELNQLAESVAVGRAAVAKELGMTGEEFEEAMRAGEIKAAEGLEAIFAAMEKRSGGAAAQMAEATAGEMDRLMEVLSSGAGKLTRPFYDAVGDFAGFLAERMGQVDLEAVGQGVFDTIAGFGRTIADLASRIDWDAVMGGARAALDWIAGAAPGVMSAVGGFLERVPDIARGVVDVVGQVVDALRPAMPFVQNVVLPLLKGIAIGVIGGVVAAFKLAVPVIKVIATALGWIGEAAKPLRPVIETVGKVIGFLFGPAILGGIARLALMFTKAGGVVGKVGSIVATAAKVAALPMRVLDRVLRGVLRVFGLLGRGVMRAARLFDEALAFVRRYVGFMSGLPGRIGRIVVNMVGRFVSGLARLPGAAMRAGRSVVTAIGRFLGSLPSRMWTWMSGAARELSGGRVLAALGNAAKRIGKAIVDGIVGFIKGAPGAIASAIGSVLPGPLRGLFGGAPDAAARTAAAALSSGGGMMPGANASGGLVPRGGWSWVGERGPELARFPAGARIYPAGQSERMAAAGQRMASRAEQLYATLLVNLDGRELHRGVHRVERAKVEFA